MSLASKAAVVTGSTSGIGLAYRARLRRRRRQYRHQRLRRRPPTSRRSAPAIETDFEVKALYSRADMTKPRGDRRHGRPCGEKTFGSVDILVNNAGIQFVSPIEDFPIEKWDQIIAINLSSAFHAIRAAVPGMKARKWGRIINTASAHSLVASPFKSAYVVGQARHRRPHQDRGAGARDLRDHLQLHLPRLCLDAAGREADPRHHEGAQHDQGAGHQRRAAGTRSRPRSSSPSEQVAALALFLCGDAAAQITGANLRSTAAGPRPSSATARPSFRRLVEHPVDHPRRFRRWPGRSAGVAVVARPDVAVGRRRPNSQSLSSQ